MASGIEPGGGGCLGVSVSLLCCFLRGSWVRDELTAERPSLVPSLVGVEARAYAPTGPAVPGLFEPQSVPQSEYVSDAEIHNDVGGDRQNAGEAAAGDGDKTDGDTAVAGDTAVLVDRWEVRQRGQHNG